LEAAHSTQQVELLNSAFLALLLHMFRGTLLSSAAGDLWFSPLVLTSLFQRHTINQRMGWYPVLSFIYLSKLWRPSLPIIIYTGCERALFCPANLMCIQCQIFGLSHTLNSVN